MTDNALPIDMEDGLNLGEKPARVYGERLSSKYTSATPFPHIVIDNFLPERFVKQLLENFPVKVEGAEKYYEKGYKGLHKRQIDPNSCDSAVRGAFAFFNSAPMLTFLENLTSIKGLIPDPHFTGGGSMRPELEGCLVFIRISESTNNDM